MLVYVGESCFSLEELLEIVYQVNEFHSYLYRRLRSSPFLLQEVVCKLLVGKINIICVAGLPSSVKALLNASIMLDVTYLGVRECKLLAELIKRACHFLIRVPCKAGAGGGSRLRTEFQMERTPAQVSFNNLAAAVISRQ